jgi:hypothetical protein
MPFKRPLLLAITLAFPVAAQQPPDAPTAQDIMSRVAANQDRTEAARLHYVYIQHARVRSLKGSNLRCEEITDTRITPTETGSDQQLLKLDGRLLHKGRYITYTTLPAPKNQTNTAKTDDKDTNVSIDNDSETDRDLVENMRSNLVNDKSKDGINNSLFPLTTKEQAGDAFELLGREHLNGHDVYHITFHPKDRSDFGWKGDAYIDTASFEPVLVRTAMARKVPLGVRVLLGTNVPGLGFSITYAPQPDGVWFPIAFGTEFKIHVLFFFSREIIIDAHNLDFEKTHVTSQIYPAPSVPQHQQHDRFDLPFERAALEDEFAQRRAK